VAFDLHAVQSEIISYLRTQYPQYVFHRNTVPEDQQVPRDDEEVNPFFIMQFGPMIPRFRGKSVKGARNDEYYSWFQLIGVGSVEDDISASLSFVVDGMIGRKLPGATRLIPDGGTTDYGSRQYSVRPVLYYQTQRFEFGLTQNGVGSFLSA
jgi:hypothetical protein